MKPAIQLVMCDPYLAGIYGRKFEEAGYKVQVIETPEDALRHAGKTNPKVILYDIHCTPDPAAVVKAFRASPTLSLAKIVLVGNTMDWDRVQELAKLSDGYLIYGQFVPREAVEKINHMIL